MAGACPPFVLRLAKQCCLRIRRQGGHYLDLFFGWLGACFFNLRAAFFLRFAASSSASSSSCGSGVGRSGFRLPLGGVAGWGAVNQLECCRRDRASYPVSFKNAALPGGKEASAGASWDVPAYLLFGLLLVEPPLVFV